MFERLMRINESSSREGWLGCFFIFMILASFFSPRVVAVATEPLSCDNKLYQIVSGKLYDVNGETAESTFLADLLVKSMQVSGNNRLSDLNALAYNPVDGFQYYTANPNRLFRVDANMNVEYLGVFTGNNYNAGAMALDGTFYVLNSGSKTLSILDVDSMQATKLSYAAGASKFSTVDIAIDPRNEGVIYGWDINNRILKRMYLTGSGVSATVSKIESVGSGNNAFREVGSLYFEASGDLIGYSNDVNNPKSQETLIRINTTTGVVQVIGEGESTSSNDGASCAYGLEFYKTTSSRTLNLGETFTYTFDIENSSSKVLDDVVFEDQLQSGFLWASEPYDLNGITISATTSLTGNALAKFSIDSIQVGNSSFKIDVTVPGVIEEATYENTAYLKNLPFQLGENVSSDNSQTAVPDDPTPVTIAKPELSFTKIVDFAANGDTAPLGVYNLGDKVIYTLSVENSGAIAATDLKLSDALPVALNYIAASVSGGDSQNDTDPHATVVGQPDGLVWSIANLAPSSQEEFTFEAEIINGAGGVINNQAVLTASNVSGNTLSDDPNLPDSQDPTPLEVSQVPDLRFIKTYTLVDDNDASNSPSSGDTLEYTLTLTHQSGPLADDIVVYDPVPAGLTYVAGSMTAGDARDDSDPANSISGSPLGLTWHLNQLNVTEQVTLTFRVTVDDGEGQVIYNQAKAVANIIGVLLSDDDTLAGDDNSTPVTIDLVPNAVDDQLLIEINNTAFISALLNDDFGDGLALFEVDSTSSQGGSVSINTAGTANKTDDYIIYTPANNYSGQDNFTYRITDSDGDERQATVWVNVSAPNLTLTLTKDSNLIPESLLNDADLSQTITALDTVRYQLRFSNSRGSADAQSGILTPVLPAGISISNAGALKAVVTNDLGISTDIAFADGGFDLGVFGEEFSGTVSIDLLIAADKAGEDLTIGFDLAWGPQNSRDSRSVSAPLMVGKVPDLAFTKSVQLVNDADRSGKISVGDIVEYTLIIANDDAGVALNLAVKDQLDTALDYISGSMQGGNTRSSSDPSGAGLNWTVEKINAGQSVNLSFQAQVLPNATEVPNQAKLRGNFSGVIDSDGNDNITGNQQTIIDLKKPDVTLSIGAVKANGDYPVTVTFSENVTGFVESELVVTGGALSNFAGSGTTYTADVTPAAGQDGTIRINVAADVAKDSDGNLNAAAAEKTQAYSLQAPNVAIAIGAVKANGDYPVTVTFSESVTGFEQSELVVAGGALTNFAGSGTTYTADVTPAAGQDGTIRINVAADVAEDSDDNLNTAATEKTQAYSLQAPSVSIAIGTVKASGDYPVTVTFSESVTGFEQSELVVAGGALTNFAGSGTTYTADVTPAAGIDGTIRINVAADVAKDSDGNLNTAAAEKTQAYSLQAPSVAIAIGTVKANGDYPVTVTFSESVTGFEQSELVVTGGEVSNFAGSGTTYTADVTPVADQDGTLHVNVAADVAIDADKNSNTKADEITQSYDLTQPSVVFEGVPALSNEPFTMTIRFSEPVSGFEITDIVSSGADLSQFAGNGAVYTVIVTPTDANVSLSIPAGVAEDRAGNTNTKADDASATYDITRPEVAFEDIPSHANGAFIATIRFDEAVNGFDQSDIKVTGATLSGFKGSADEYTVIVTPVVPSTEITLNIDENVALDLANNGNTEGQEVVVAFDDSPPTVSFEDMPEVINGEFEISVVFNEAVEGLNPEDFVITGGKVVSLTGTGKNYAVTIAPNEDAEAETHSNIS